MTQTPTRFPQYAADFQALTAAEDGLAWLGHLRQRAWERFTELGMPTLRRGNEKWKYTDVRRVASVAFTHPLDLDPEAGVDPSLLARAAPGDPGWTRLVFIDGRFCPSLSSSPPDGVVVGSLAAAGNGTRAVLEQRLAQQASPDDDGFVALNTAFLRDGALVHVPRNTVVSAPINLVFVTTGREQPRVTYPRTLVVAESNSQFSLLESYVSLTGDRFLTNAVTEIVLEDGANVNHYRLLLENDQAYHVGVSRVTQARDSVFSSAAFAKGAALGRNDFQVLLDGPGANCSLNGLYFTTGNQHMDNFINIDHAQPNCTSRLLYKGILDGQSRAVFGGNVTVRKQAQKTDAQQTDKNLLLSHNAEVDSKPSLLIYADDVKCGHGATAGHIDDDTLFYMRSRGLDVATASQILIHAFASEIIETVGLESVRNYLDGLYMEAIPNATLPLGRTS